MEVHIVAIPKLHLSDLQDLPIFLFLKFQIVSFVYFWLQNEFK